MKKTSIGGQALLEGLLMIGPKSSAIAVRKPDGEIVVDIKPLPKKSPVSKIPIIRGIFNFGRQMVIGIKALMYSADFAEVDGKDEEEEQGKFDKFLDKLLGEKAKDAAIYLAVIIGIAFSVGLFILLPNFIINLIFPGEKSGGSVFLINLLEGVLRLSIFVGYLLIVSKMNDIKRVWQYHGAEHKTIHAYEHDEELTVENVKKYSTRHPRCGTSFLFLIMIISILLFSLVGWHNMWINIVARVLLIPIVAGVSYEILKFAGRSELKCVKILNAPGLAFQYLTTKEPDDDMIEVAIAAFKSVAPTENGDSDKY
ncbi:MAG: DUF1385 domain-containing protein [Eubacteriales bacterium]|nr:DUF1385 domain-containing protein [Eubacteriales bacterium]